MFFRQIYDEGLAQASYMVGSEASCEALVVDPRRDIGVYTDLAARHDLRIVAVTETHIHADFLSGGRELAAATGATLYVSGEGGDPEQGYRAGAGVRTEFLRNGSTIRIGDIRVVARHTPGHTPEHLSFEVFDGPAKEQPMLLLSGDFLFVGDVGRPDLLEEALGVAGAAKASAHALYASLRRALADLPDFVQIWPAHGAGSACGKALGAVPSSTLGYERRFSWWSSFLEARDENGFVSALLDGQPDAPSYFARMKRLNRGETPLLGKRTNPPRLDRAAVASALAGGAVLLDSRDREAFCEQHVKGSINVPSRANFSTRAAWFVPDDKPLVLVAPAGRVANLVQRLVRVGLDDVVGYVLDISEIDLPKLSLPPASLDEAKQRWAAHDALILDVRSRNEFIAEHIPQAQHVSAGQLAATLSTVPKDRPIIVHCAGGDRSVGAASVLEAAGFENVSNMADGFSQWHERGFPTDTGS